MPTAKRNITTSTRNMLTANRLLMTYKKMASYNMRLASCGVKCLNSSSVFQINFSAGLTVLCPEIPHERQAQKRCMKPLTNETQKKK